MDWPEEEATVVRRSRWNEPAGATAAPAFVPAGVIHGATASFVTGAILALMTGVWLDGLARYGDIRFRWTEPVADTLLAAAPLAALLGALAAVRGPHRDTTRRRSAAGLILLGIASSIYAWAVGDVPSLLAGISVCCAGLAALGDLRAGTTADGPVTWRASDRWPAGLLILAALAIGWTFLVVQGVENQVMASVDCYADCSGYYASVGANNAQVMPWLALALLCLALAPLTVDRECRRVLLAGFLLLAGSVLILSGLLATDPFDRAFLYVEGPLLPEWASLWFPALLMLAAAARLALRSAGPIGHTDATARARPLRTRARDMRPIDWPDG